MHAEEFSVPIIRSAKAEDADVMMGMKQMLPDKTVSVSRYFRRLSGACNTPLYISLFVYPQFRSTLGQI